MDPRESVVSPWPRATSVAVHSFDSPATAAGSLGHLPQGSVVESSGIISPAGTEGARLRLEKISADTAWMGIK
jgi:hypothetical protein